MGMELTLYPADVPGRLWVWHLGRAALRLSRDYSIFAQISEKVMGKRDGVEQVCDPKPLPPNVRFTVYEDEGLQDRRTDPYGAGITYVEAWELKKVKLAEDASPWNKAIFALIHALPDDYPVILMWC